METIIKGKEVIAYKGMKSDMTCRDFKYELGKTYKTDSVELCNCGFHACLNPRNVLDYYKQDEDSRYFKVKLSGEIAKCDKSDTKVAATEITILEEINIDEIIKITEWWKNDNVLDLLYFSDGFARVQRGDDKWNFIDKNGNYLYDEWYNDVFNFHDGFAKVQRGDGLWNFIDKDGKILSDEWFDWVDYFNKDGFARVKRTNGKWNFIDKDGKILSDEWFDWVDYFQDGFTKVRRGDELYNFIDKDSKILSDEWFDWVDYFNKDGFAVVRRTNGERAKIDKTGKLIKILQ